MSPGHLHGEVLPEVQQQVLLRIAPFIAARSFYMAGDTVLALQLGHRQSVDFDWFRPQPISDPVGLAADLGLAVRTTALDTLHALTDGVQLSFFHYRYPLLEPAIRSDEFGCDLASIRDIAAMKLAAVSQRGARKDYYDLVAIGRTGLDLDAMLDAYRRKFAVADIGHVLASLAWFDDADKDPEPVLAAQESWDHVKATIREWVKRAARS